MDSSIRKRLLGNADFRRFLSCFADIFSAPVVINVLVNFY